MAYKILTLSDLLSIKRIKAIDVTKENEWHLDLVEPNRFYLSNYLTYLLDTKLGVKYIMTAVDVNARALSTLPGLGNPHPISAVYMASLIVNKPSLPDDVLVDVTRAPKANIKHYDPSVILTVATVNNLMVEWVTPSNGIASVSNPGYYHINGFPNYLINEMGVIIYKDTGDVHEPDLNDPRVTTLYDVNNVRRDVMLVDIMRLAFGLYTDTGDSPVYYKDGDDTNIILSNLTSVFNTNANYSVALQEGDEDGIINY